MCPFHTIPDGVTPEMLELLDRTFSATWRELAVDGSAMAASEGRDGARAAIDNYMIELKAVANSNAPAHHIRRQAKGSALVK